MKPAPRPLNALAACVLALSTGFSLPATALADGDAACADAPVRLVATVLELTPGQVQAWGPILAARGEALGPLAEQIRQRQQAIAAQLQSGSPDPALIGRLLIEVHALQAQVHAVDAQAAARFRELLNLPQRQKLDQVRRAALACPVVPAFAAVGLVPAGAAAPQ